ncbi:hypothetical protein IAG41_08580 [Sphingomonas sp. JC676]|uniref:hypothetical protein n=1 Tax=Sphingomonas sp. JC676 TaxID=2768065 RepID=UPI0016585966|nr:hypothetical protein [Sphingomonas sp. JC676]MBC9032444.1 hypothetical protein [Sphingomonas sp. JC676]
MMQKPNILRPRAALLIGAAIIATPAFAQDQSVTPPPILTTPAPAPAPATPARVIQVTPSAPVVQSVPSVEDQQRGSNASAAPAEAAPAPARRTTSTTTRQTTRATAPVRATAPARTAAPAPAPAAAPAPVAQAPVTPPAPPPQETAVTPPAAEPAPAPVAEAPVVATTETTRSTGIAWPWLAGGVLLVLAGLAALLMMGRRRRNDEEVTSYAEPTYVAPVDVEPALDEAVLVSAPEPRGRPKYVPPVATAPAAPIAAAPIAAAPVVAAPIAAAPVAAPVREAEVTPVAEAVEAHEEIEIARPEEQDLAGVADAHAPVANRPWLEFGLRPVRAGTSEEEALVDIELTIGNSGDTAAKDVRISAFMLADEDAGEMEKRLTEHRDDAHVPPVTIAAGDGTRVDAHLAIPKGELGRTFNPVVVAEARYTLPDGSEGHTQAAFKIGRPAPSEAGVGAIGATRPHMVENLEAELLGTPEHA